MKNAAHLWSDKIISFFNSLPPLQKLPRGIVAMNPYRDRETMEVVMAFYKKYYNDAKPRTLLLGINPGRFGSGTTGISFTDPIRLEKNCGIPNSLPKKPELSSDFVYRMIDAFGGTTEFYKKYFISAVSPLGFTRGGTNINYYDDKKLEAAVEPFAATCISRMRNMGLDRRRCFCIGEGKNLQFLNKLNNQHRWFKELVPLSHPRFIMQYRRKQLDQYISSYLEHLA